MAHDRCVRVDEDVGAVREHRVSTADLNVLFHVVRIESLRQLIGGGEGRFAVFVEITAE